MNMNIAYPNLKQTARGPSKQPSKKPSKQPSKKPSKQPSKPSKKSSKVKTPSHANIEEEEQKAIELTPAEEMLKKINQKKKSSKPSKTLSKPSKKQSEEIYEIPIIKRASTKRPDWRDTIKQLIWQG